MWLLNTSTLQRKFFHSPESVPGGYAIVSHVWGEKETIFQHIEPFPDELSEAVTTSLAESPTISHGAASHGNADSRRPGMSPPFRLYANKGGHEWAWAETCCIDKASSAELTEATNSMYRYYSLADVCYVYSADVETTDPSCTALEDSPLFKHEFMKSKWHNRGWTLQELIAPKVVVFLSRSWEVLGTKMDLAPLLEHTTQVPAKVLTLNAEPADY